MHLTMLLCRLAFCTHKPPTTMASAISLDSTYGSMLIGVYFATFFQGLLTLQAYHYYDRFPNDPLVNKVIVGTVWCIDAMQLIFVAKSAYHYLVTNWGVQEALLTSIWELDIQLTFIGLSAFICQLFFLNRILVLSKRNYLLVAFLFLLCLCTLALDVLVTVQITTVRLVTEFTKRKAEIIAVFTSGAASDVFIALSLCYYLRKDRSGFRSTNSLVATVIQFTLATGLATSAFAIASVIAYFSNPNGFYFIAIHFSLGRMYTNALLATLNAREKLRSKTIQIGQSSSNNSRRDGHSLSNPVQNSSIRQYVSPFQGKGPTMGLSAQEPLTVKYTVEQRTKLDIDIELDDVAKKQATFV